MPGFCHMPLIRIAAVLCLLSVLSVSVEAKTPKNVRLEDAASEAASKTSSLPEISRKYTAYSMLTHDGRRMVSYRNGTNTVYELMPTNRLSADLPPVREWKLYGLKATHTDIGLHNPPYVQRHGTVKYIDEAARLVDIDSRKDDDPAAYRYVMEGGWFWDNYCQDKGCDVAWRIVTNHIARGRMDIGVTCAGNHTHLFSETEIERSLWMKRLLADKWGIGAKAFIMADNPGISCSVIRPYVKAGIRYGIFLPNQWNPIPSTIWTKNASLISSQALQQIWKELCNVVGTL